MILGWILTSTWNFTRSNLALMKKMRSWVQRLQKFKEKMNKNRNLIFTSFNIVHGTNLNLQVQIPSLILVLIKLEEILRINHLMKLNRHLVILKHHNFHFLKIQKRLLKSRWIIKRGRKQKISYIDVANKWKMNGRTSFHLSKGYWKNS